MFKFFGSNTYQQLSTEQKSEPQTREITVQPIRPIFLQAQNDVIANPFAPQTIRQNNVNSNSSTLRDRTSEFGSIVESKTPTTSLSTSIDVSVPLLSNSVVVRNIPNLSTAQLSSTSFSQTATQTRLQMDEIRQQILQLQACKYE